MLVGSMNFPGRSISKEIHRIAEDNFDFIDLTIEPPAAWDKDFKDAGRLCRELGLGIVGHTAWYIPIASAFPELRKVAKDLYRRALDGFADAGVELVNIHPDQRVPMYSADQVKSFNVESIAELAQDAEQRGIRLMVENLDQLFSDVNGLKPILDGVPGIGFHLDIAHANLRLGRGGENRTRSLLDAFGDRLAHVHVSDNRGGTDDLHLPLGAGTIDWKGHLRMLKALGYDGTITLEVFSREREHLRTSRKLLLKWWSDA